MKSLVTASILILFFLSCNLSKTESVKINGVSYVASSEAVTQKNIEPIINIHANYAAIMPFGFIKNINDPILQFEDKNRWFGETEKGVKQYISKLHENNIQVMLKPQIWVWQGEYTGQLKMHTEEEWKIFEDTYRNFILDFAKVAQESQVEIPPFLSGNTLVAIGATGNGYNLLFCFSNRNSHSYTQLHGVFTQWNTALDLFFTNPI